MVRNVGILLLCVFVQSLCAGMESKSDDPVIAPQASKIGSKLSAEVQSQVRSILNDARDLIGRKEYRKAVEASLKAIAVVPDPQDQHKEMVEILATIGEANFRAKAFDQAKNAFSDAMHFPGAIGDPQLHLRLGECQLEVGNLQRAKDELARAAMGGGKDIFAAEDPKYWKFISAILKAPPGGW